METVTLNGSSGVCGAKMKAGLMRLVNGKMIADPRKGVLKVIQVS
jgi:hypothetical protein